MRLAFSTAFFLVCVLLFSQELAESEDFEQYDSLFEDQEALQEEAAHFAEFEQLEAEQKFELFGEHGTRLPFPVNPDYLNYAESQRAFRFYNFLGVAYSEEHVVLDMEFYVDYYSSDGSPLQDLVTGLGEASVSFYNDFLNFSVGFMEHAWGSALVFNPTDNLNPRDYRSGLFPQKRTVPSLRLSLYPIRELSLETVYIPVYQSGIGAVTITELEAMFNQYIPSTLLPDALEFDFSQAQIGEKLTFFLSFADLSLSYLYDLDDFYSITEQLTDASAGKAVLTLKRRRLHRIGFDITGSLGAATLWAELAGTIAEDLGALSDEKMRNHSLSWTLGTDFYLGRDDFIHLTFQQMGTYIFDYKTSYEEKDALLLLNYALAQQSEGLRLGVMADISFSLLNDTLLLSMRGAYFLPLQYNSSSPTRYGALLFSPGIEILPIDSLSILIGAELSGAWQDGGDARLVKDELDPLEKLSRFNKIYIELVYTWSKGI